MRDNYSKDSVIECAKRLGRSPQSIKKKAIRMGLSSKRHSWTVDEELYLKNNYYKDGPSKLSKIMGIPKLAISQKAQKMGIKVGFKRKSKTSTKNNTGRKLSEETKRKIGDANKIYSSPKLCIDCGKPLGKRVSIRCKHCDLKSRAGEGHMWWKGGLSDLRNITSKMLYNAWKFPILERDGFKCIVCGSSENLEVHHIHLYHEIRDNVLASNKHLSLDIYEDKVKIAKKIVSAHSDEIGVTLCRSCHMKIHWEKQGELLETPNGVAEDNQQPSSLKVKKVVSEKVQRLMGEDSLPISPTRAPCTT